MNLLSRLPSTINHFKSADFKPFLRNLIMAQQQSSRPSSNLADFRQKLKVWPISFNELPRITLITCVSCCDLKRTTSDPWIYLAGSKQNRYSHRSRSFCRVWDSHVQRRRWIVETIQRPRSRHTPSLQQRPFAGLGILPLQARGGFESDAEQSS